jgi:hypothetical protein
MSRHIRQKNMFKKILYPIDPFEAGKASEEQGARADN